MTMFEKNDLGKLTSDQLRTLVTAALDELQNRPGANAYYPVDLFREYRAGAAAALDEIDAWQGHDWVNQFTLNNWQMPDHVAAQLLEEWPKGCED